MFADLNYIAVLVAALISMVIGMIWYAPPVFGAAWMESAGLTKKDAEKTNMTQSMFFGFLSNVLMAAVLAAFIGTFELTTAMGGAELAFWFWLGFVATQSLGSVLWENKSMAYYLINVSHSLVSFLVIGAVLASWV